MNLKDDELHLLGAATATTPLTPSQQKLATAKARQVTAEKALSDWNLSHGLTPDGSVPPPAGNPGAAAQGGVVKPKWKTALYVSLGLAAAAALGTGGYFLWRRRK